MTSDSKIVQLPLHKAFSNKISRIFDKVFNGIFNLHHHQKYKSYRVKKKL